MGNFRFDHGRGPASVRAVPPAVRYTVNYLTYNNLYNIFI
jgi:hypothetical protein